MKQLILLFCLVLFLFVAAEAQYPRSQRINGKYGFVDISGKEVIPPKYDDAGNFYEGLAAVKLQNKWGFIDLSTNLVIPFKYENTYIFKEGLAKVKLNGKWGYIDKIGKEIIPFIYETSGNFTEGMAFFGVNGKYGFIDKTGKEIIVPKYENIREFNGGFAPVQINGKWGFIDKTGKEITPIIYDNTGNFSDGLASVKQNNKWGYIDASGKEVVPIIYDYTPPFTDGEAEVKIDGKQFFIDKTGTKSRADLVTIKKILSPADGLQLARNIVTNKYGYINERNRIIIPFIYESAGLFGNNRAPVTLNGKKMYIDKTGKEVINAEGYSYAQTFYNGYAVVENDKKMRAFIDTTGKLMTQFIYSSADAFTSGLAAVCQNGKCGFLGLDFKPAIPLIYKSVGYFSESGLARVCTMQGKFGYINNKGAIVIPLIYDEASEDWNLIKNNPRSEWPFHTYMVKTAGKKKYLDAGGKDVTPAPLINTEDGETPKIAVLSMANFVEKKDIKGLIDFTKKAGITGYKEQNYFGNTGFGKSTKTIKDSSVIYTSNEKIKLSAGIFGYLKIEHFKKGNIEILYPFHWFDMDTVKKEIANAGYVLEFENAFLHKGKNIRIVFPEKTDVSFPYIIIFKND
jgi:hypothetical protein